MRVRPLALYVTSFVLVVAAGLALLVSVREFFASTRLLWVSAALSIAAILVAAVTVVRRSRER